MEWGTNRWRCFRMSCMMIKIEVCRVGGCLVETCDHGSRYEKDHVRDWSRGCYVMLDVD